MRFHATTGLLSEYLEVMAERNLRFYAFDAITYNEWYGRSRQEQFSDRFILYYDFCQAYKFSGLILPVKAYRHDGLKVRNPRVADRCSTGESVLVQC